MVSWMLTLLPRRVSAAPGLPAAGLFAAAALLAVASLPGCNAEQAIDLLEKTAEAPAPPTAAIPRPSSAGTNEPAAGQPLQTAAVVRRSVQSPQRDKRKLRVGSFNIQVFGESKARKPAVMAVLADILARFDVLAVQEIRSKDQSHFAALVDQVNQVAPKGSQYRFVVGPRLGRTVSKEQYAFVWDASRVSIYPESVYTMPDDKYDDFHREPLVATFQTRTPTGRTPFRFTLINMHTDPDEEHFEIDRLDDVLVAIQRYDTVEDDLILLGDFNADENNLGELSRMRNIVPLLRGVPTNVRRTQTYDNLIVHRLKTNEWTGQSGVLDFQREYGLTDREALEVSDHFPVWADFEPIENAGQFLAEEPLTR